ncbi:MAG: NAD(P)/FAD-dependent oxidoreductase [Bacteroidetes bacterium]|nr:NAD(P)/FAD-dependent oxidoreductase [Bacteroidota bacterium]
MPQRLIVIGGGAAGFFCAVNAARMNRQLEVIIVEKTNKLLAKVKISGGGRCNVTHACFSIPEMLKRYPRGVNFIKKSFHQFFTTDTIQWFEERGVKLKTEKDGRIFPVSDSSESIIQCLMREADTYGVSVLMNREVRNIKRSNEKWNLEFANAEIVEADFICIATGGYPKTSMFEWIREPGHSVEDPVPSLFSFNMPGNSITALTGVAVSEAEVKIAGTKLVEKGPLLITHWGMSGPVILRLSAWGARVLATNGPDYHFTIIVNWVPTFNEHSMRERILEIRSDNGSHIIGNKNPFALPQRLWEYLLQQSGINAVTRWADIKTVSQNKLIKNLCSNEFSVRGKTTFKEEFVTAGGVNLLEVDANTMQSRILPNLFFAGEVLDVDGITGGFNFQHAWTSGFVAAKEIARRTMG